MSEFEQAAGFRERAHELRRKADEFSPKNREMLMNMADNYDAIANDLMTALRKRDLKILKVQTETVPYFRTRRR